jgi:glycosyltransferase involved in cell wall biosynthesis
VVGFAMSPTFDPTLLAVVPLTARSVAYLGPAVTAFAQAYARANPLATVTEDIAEAEAIVVDGVPPPTPVARPDTVWIVRAAPPDTPRWLAAFEALDLRVTKRRGDILVAVPGALTAPLVHLELWAFAPVLMDIRTRLPMAQLDSHPLISARAHTPPFTLPDLPSAAPKLVISQRPGRYPEPHLRRWLAETLAKGWLPVLETDDHPALMARVKGRPVDDLDWLSARGMAAVQTSTPRLAADLGQHNPEVAAFPNAVFDLPTFDPAGRERRVFYGAISRGLPAIDMARAMAPAIADAPEVEFVVVGDRDVFDALPTNRKRFADFMGYGAYLDLMRQCAVTLSPLSGADFETAKSDAKFLDAARSGTLMIASPAVYGGVIRHGENGLIAREPEDWPRLLAQALRDEPARRRMTRAAWEEVRSQRMFAAQIETRRAWYLDLWTRREALEAAMCERLPGLSDEIRRARASRPEPASR